MIITAEDSVKEGGEIGLSTWLFSPNMKLSFLSKTLHSSEWYKPFCIPVICR